MLILVIIVVCAIVAPKLTKGMLMLGLGLLALGGAAFIL